jgi:hypothetical protein
MSNDSSYELHAKRKKPPRWWLLSIAEKEKATGRVAFSDLYFYCTELSGINWHISCEHLDEGNVRQSQIFKMNPVARSFSGCYDNSYFSAQVERVSCWRE